MALPEIPASWFQLIQLLVTSAVLILSVLGYKKADDAITLGHENGAKIEAAAEITHTKLTGLDRDFKTFNVPPPKGAGK